MWLRLLTNNVERLILVEFAHRGSSLFDERGREFAHRGGILFVQREVESLPAGEGSCLLRER